MNALPRTIHVTLAAVAAMSVLCFGGVASAQNVAKTASIQANELATTPGPNVVVENGIPRMLQARPVSAPRFGGIGGFGAGFGSIGFVPRHQRVMGIRVVGDPVTEGVLPAPVVQPGEGNLQMVPGPMVGGPVVPGAMGAAPCGGCGGPCGAECGEVVGPCDPCPAVPYCLLPVPCFSMENLTLNAGVHGTKGPRSGEYGVQGSFGFQEGVNWGAPVWLLPNMGIGMQYGFQAMQSNFSDFEDREQYFLTSGVFRRVDCGLQMGVVMDYLRDEWVTNVDIVQIRGELSWVYPCRHEWGFTFATNAQADLGWYSEDTYTFFYRRRFDECGGGEGRLFGGWTGTSDGLLGGDIHLPISDRWALDAAFTYLIPGENDVQRVGLEEVWNVGINLVWYPRCNARTAKANCYQPLLPVADNGSMMLRR